jgi:uncharacterized protein (TIGR00369 family)
MTTREAYHKYVTAVVTNTYIHRHLDLKLTFQGLENGVPTVRCEFIATERHLLKGGNVHGGISSLIMDTACGLAVIPTSEIGQGTATLASSFQILRSVVGAGKKYEVVARVLKRGKNVVFCEAETSCEGKLIAKGNFTKIVTEGHEVGESKL